MPLAIASGISAKNVRQFMPLAQAFLVASSVTDPGELTNAEKVRELVGAAKS
jgi:predicted TIM-barrel enzyme